MKIQMVDLKNQYLKLKSEIDSTVLKVIEEGNFINGPEVNQFTNNLSEYLDGINVIPCANGTDALQLAMMGLGLKPGDEVIVPAFTYVATAEVISLLNLTPVMVDVDLNNFNLAIKQLNEAITKNTKAIVPVHLYGQCVDMEPILGLAEKFGLYIIEDVAQAIGAEYTFKNGIKKKAGTIGDIGCTSFFPSKNLGCFGDGGALFTKNKILADKIKMIANHGQEVKYKHKYIGINSRLDTLQAAILNIKLKNLEGFINSRQKAAEIYDNFLVNIKEIEIPYRSDFSSHVFHQYTIKIKNGKRDLLKKYLDYYNIPSMIYYPIPLNKQEAYINNGRTANDLENTKNLCDSVLSLPMHTELSFEEQEYIYSKIYNFFYNK
jgi:UDP-2-acetamido-2-deoxy-ribo-hexuluronate aminotransferase